MLDTRQPVDKAQRCWLRKLPVYSVGMPLAFSARLERFSGVTVATIPHVCRECGRTLIARSVITSVPVAPTAHLHLPVSQISGNILM